MGQIYLEKNEPIERALKRFKKACQHSGILAEMKKREHYEKPSVRRKKKIEAAKRKVRRRLSKINNKLDKIESI